MGSVPPVIYLSHWWSPSHPTFPPGPHHLGPHGNWFFFLGSGNLAFNDATAQQCFHFFLKNWNNYTPDHPWKLTWHWKKNILNRKYIFTWLVFHCHVSFRVGNHYQIYLYMKSQDGPITCVNPVVLCAKKIPSMKQRCARIWKWMVPGRKAVFIYTLFFFGGGEFVAYIP